MATTISDGLETLTATLMTGYAVKRATRNVIHRVLGANAPAVSLREGALRSGTIPLLFESEAIARAAVAMLASDAELTLTDTDRTAIGMTFVVSGDVELELEDETRNAWLVRFDFEETD
jgi:hypothetical protein